MTSVVLYEPSGLAGGERVDRLAWASAIARRATVADKFSTVRWCSAFRPSC